MLLDDPELQRAKVTGANLEDFSGSGNSCRTGCRRGTRWSLVTGLAWTSVGGETLEVEVNVMDGSGKLELTGNLGDVMKESAHAALSCHPGQCPPSWGVPSDFYKTKDIHVHFPEGAVPKMGLPRGVTVCTAMVAPLTGQTVRQDVAMTEKSPFVAGYCPSAA